MVHSYFINEVNNSYGSGFAFKYGSTGFKSLLRYFENEKRHLDPFAQSWQSKLWFITGMHNKLNTLKVELKRQIEFLKQSKDDQLVVRSRSSKEKFWTSQEYFLREIEKKRNYERESSQLKVRRRLPKTV